MIKIRYADLPEGLHATVEAQGRRTVIYLRPALEPAQRRGALRRVRRMAQIGNGPPLSASGIALAMARDTARSTARNGMAAIRCHPAGSLFLTALLASATVCYMFFVSVSIHLIPAPPARGALPVLGSVSASAPGQRHSEPRGASGLGGEGGEGGLGGQQVNGPGPTSSSGSAASARASASAAAGASASASAVPSDPVPSQLAASPVPLPPSPAQSSSPSPGPTAASPAPSAPSADPGGLCVDVGPLGVCLSVHA